MNPAFIRQRLIRILTRPPELLYALSRHWFFTLTFLILGTGVAALLVVAKPLVYEGKALLQITSENPMDVIESNSNLGSFLPTQQSIIKSEPVVRATVANPNDAQLITAQLELEGYDPRLENLPPMLKPYAKRLSNWLSIDMIDTGNIGEEKIRQRAIQSFIMRSEVRPMPPSSDVELVLYGTDRARIRKELNQWIDAYKTRVEELAESRKKNKLQTWSRAYERVVTEAKRDLDKFQEGHVGLTRERLNDHDREIARLRVNIDKIKGDIENENFLEDTKDELLALELESKIAELIAGGVSEDSRQIGHLRGLVEKYRESTPKNQEELIVERKDEFEKYLTVLESDLHDEYLARGALEIELNSLAMLEQGYRNALGKRDIEKDRSIMIGGSEIIIDVVGNPVVGTEPFEYQPGRIVLGGALGGLLLGWVLSIFYEVLYNKVRFKQDVIADFSMPVVAVFPR